MRDRSARKGKRIKKQRERTIEERARDRGKGAEELRRRGRYQADKQTRTIAQTQKTGMIDSE